MSAIYIGAERIRAIAGNIIAGIEDTGITAVFQESCYGGSIWDTGAGATIAAAAGRFDYNEIFTGMVGIRLLPVPGMLALEKCVHIQKSKVWLMSDVGVLTLDQKANVKVSSVVISDCNVGISLNFIRAGSKNIVELADSIIAGSTAASSCEDGQSCRSYGPTDTLAEGCNSIYGKHVRRVGVALPRYTTMAQTCGGDGSKEVCRPVTRPIKQCAAPWLKRYSRVSAELAQMKIKDTIFYKFRSLDCAGKTTRAIATLADEADFAPALELEGITWLQTDAAVRLKLGYDARLNPSACGRLCDVVNFQNVRDLDGSTSGIAGSTMVSAQLPELTTGAAQCQYNRDTASYICKEGYRLVHAALEVAKKIGPVTITRAGKSYGSIGATDEQDCAPQKKGPRYPFTVALAGTSSVTTVKPSGAMTADGRIVWFAARGDVMLVELVFMQAVENLHIYMDHRDQQLKKLSGDQTPTIESPPGTWAYNVAAKKLTLVMHGHYSEYQWAPKEPSKPAAKMKLAMLIDVPPTAPAGFKAQVVEKYTAAILLSTARRLNIPKTRFKVVCVHPVGQPCLKGRLARREEEDGDEGEGEGDEEVGEEAAAKGAATEYDFEYEITMPNEDNGFDDDGNKLKSYDENAAFAESVTAEIEEMVGSNELAELLANASSVANVTDVVVSTTQIRVSSASAGIEFAGVPSADGAGIVLKTYATGVVYEDSDMNGVYSDNDDSADAAITGATIQIREVGVEGGDVFMETIQTDDVGGWSLLAFNAGSVYEASVVLESIVDDGGTRRNRKANDGSVFFWKCPSVKFLASSSEVELVSLGCEQWTTIAGYIGTATNASSEQEGIADVVVYLTGRGVDGSATTGIDGKWSSDVPAGGAWSVEVDVSTLPFPQPYAGEAVVGSAVVSSDEALADDVHRGASGIVAVFPPFGMVGGLLTEEFSERDGDGVGVTQTSPLQGAYVVVTDGTGKEWHAESDSNGRWAASVPYGVGISVAFDPLHSPPHCLQTNTGGQFAQDSTVDASALVDVGEERYDCTNHCVKSSCTTADYPVCIDDVHTVECKSTTSTITASTIETSTTAAAVEADVSDNGGATEEKEGPGSINTASNNNGKDDDKEGSTTTTLASIELTIAGAGLLFTYGIWSGDDTFANELESSVAAMVYTTAGISADGISSVRTATADEAANTALRHRMAVSEDVIATVVFTKGVSSDEANAVETLLSDAIQDGGLSIEVDGQTFEITAVQRAVFTVFTNTTNDTGSALDGRSLEAGGAGMSNASVVGLVIGLLWACIAVVGVAYYVHLKSLKAKVKPVSADELQDMMDSSNAARSSASVVTVTAAAPPARLSTTAATAFDIADPTSDAHTVLENALAPMMMMSKPQISYGDAHLLSKVERRTSIAVRQAELAALMAAEENAAITGHESDDDDDDAADAPGAAPDTFGEFRAPQPRHSQVLRSVSAGQHRQRLASASERKRHGDVTTAKLYNRIGRALSNASIGDIPEGWVEGQVNTAKEEREAEDRAPRGSAMATKRNSLIDLSTWPKP